MYFLGTKEDYASTGSCGGQSIERLQLADVFFFFLSLSELLGRRKNILLIRHDELKEYRDSTSVL